MGSEIKIDWMPPVLIVLAAVSFGFMLLFVMTQVPLARLEGQGIYAQDPPQKATEMPRAAQSATASHVWPTATPGTPCPQVFDYTFEEVGLLASMVACEAGRESRLGKEAAAWVAKARHDRTDKSYTEVLFEPGAFTCWQLEAGSAQAELRDHYCEVLELEECQEILTVAINVINGWTPNPCEGATHFFNPSLVEEPIWASGKEPLCIIGSHWFYDG